MRYLNLLMVFATLTVLSCGSKNNNITPGNISAQTTKDTAFTEYFRRTSGWIAGDGAASIELLNGKSLWVFGDSHIDDYQASTGTTWCLFQVRNAGLTMGIGNPASQQTYTGSGSPASLFQVGTDNNYWFWPGAGYTDGDTCYVFLGRIHATGSGGAFGFETIDSMYVAKIHVPTMQVAGYAKLGSKAGISFDLAAVTDGSYTYLYGARNNGFGNDVFVARFPESNIYADWEYYGNNGWTTQIGNAKKIHDEFTSSFSFCKINGKYVMVTTAFSVGCDQGKEIYAYTASNPYGPFENKKIIWTLDDTLDGHYPFFYLANLHPEYSSAAKGLLITYCINGYGECVETCINNRINPDYYRPKAIRVPYSALGLD